MVATISTGETRPIRKGDRIKFRAVTRWSNETVTRRVVGFSPNGRPLVRYGGYPDFAVRHREIVEVTP